MTDFENGTALVMAAFFPSDDDKEAMIGKPIIFCITADLNPDSNIDQLKSSNSIHYFFDTESA